MKLLILGLSRVLLEYQFCVVTQMCVYINLFCKGMPRSSKWWAHWQRGASVGHRWTWRTKRLVSAEFAQAVYRPSQWLHLEFHDKMVVEGLIKAQKQLSAFCDYFPPARDIDPVANCPSDDYLIHLVMFAFRIANCWLHNIWWKWRSISSWCWISRHKWNLNKFVSGGVWNLSGSWCHVYRKSRWHSSLTKLHLTSWSAIMVVWMM